MSNPFKVMNNTYANMPNMNNIRQTYQMLKSKGDPMVLMQNMAQNSPQLKPILQAMNGGLSAQQIFNNLCQQRGIDPNEFIKNITG